MNNRFCPEQLEGERDRGLSVIQVAGLEKQIHKSERGLLETFRAGAILHVMYCSHETRSQWGECGQVEGVEM